MNEPKELSKDPDDILTTRTAKVDYPLSESRWRGSRMDPPICDGPPYIKIGRSVYYRRGDIEAWIAAHRVVPQFESETAEQLLEQQAAVQEKAERRKVLRRKRVA